MAIFKFTYTGSVEADSEADAIDLMEEYMEQDVTSNLIENMSVFEITDPKDPYFEYPITRDDL